MRARSAAPEIRFTEAPGRLPRGRRVYAIGDVHGCAVRLAELHRMIAADLARRPAASPLLLHIGDYIDKGSDSAGVVRLLLRDPIPGLRTVNLLGNHERMLRQVLAGDGGARADWLFCGGRETLLSYGLDPDAPSEDWAAALPAPHRAFLENGTRLALHHRAGDYLFVHAGVRPGVALEEQSEDDLLGIRHTFLQSEADHGAVIVHGHTARDAPQVRANRIGLDTAAWSGGPLTCAVLEGDRLGFLFA
jgi:serine/threonine protein phosphatase 1